MQSLNSWFNFNIKRPFYGIILLIVLIQALSFVLMLRKEQQNQDEMIKYLSVFTKQGIIKNNRELIELIFTFALNELKAKSIVLCKDDDALIFQGEFKTSCDGKHSRSLQDNQNGQDSLENQNNFFDRSIVSTLDGMPSYKIIYIIPRSLGAGQLGFILVIFLSFFASSLFLIFLIQKKLRQDIISPMIDSLAGKNVSNRAKGKSNVSSETNTRIEEIEHIYVTREKSMALEKNHAIAEAIKNQSLQVAHDIRSPLAALNMVIRQMKDIPEEQRIIVRGSVNRIQDIANELLKKNRSSHKSDSIDNSTDKNSSNFPQSLELVSSLLDSIITEKRMQYRSKLGIEIEFLPSKNSYGLFAVIDSHSLKRVISNVVNNAVEALGETGYVQVELMSELECIVIRIKDNGNGIPPEILVKLGERMGETHGKEEGNGIGLYHAKMIVESWHGKIYLESELGKGTILTIKIPKAEPPQWFVPELRVMQNGHIVILDDDSAIHQIWDGRFAQSKISNYGITVHHFSLPDQVENWIKNYFKDRDRK